jgi:L-amino acid N-acyltransferase YncA
LAAAKISRTVVPALNNTFKAAKKLAAFIFFKFKKMKANITIRLATALDAEALLAVYKPYVETTASTFEYEAPSADEYRRRINAIIPEYPWLVCEKDGVIVGYAYAHKHRERTAYQWSPESTIYLSKEMQGTGIARIMYEAVFEILKLQGFINVFASVLSTNINSNRFHRAMGFEEIGLFKNIGYKHEAWHSNIWYQLSLSEHIPNPATPKKIEEVIHATVLEEIIKIANLRANHSMGIVP